MKELMGWDIIVFRASSRIQTVVYMYGQNLNALVLGAYIAEPMLAKYHLTQYNKLARVL